ncbi:MAG TPA: hypothetical protein VFT69_03970 [Pseudolabrys sp.]|nr:hypothetical protein [Pseudolabrys sp.]
MAAAGNGLFHIGNWEGGAFAGKHGKGFDRCTAHQAHENGVTILYSLDSEYRWDLEFSSKAWNFLRGANFNAVLSFGKQQRILRRAVAISPHALRLQLADSLTLFDRLQSAWQMELVVGGLRLDFKLMDNAQVLRALTKCVAKHRRPSRLAKALGPIVASGTVRRSTGPDNNSALRLESAKLAAQIMARVTGPKSGAVALTDFPAGISADAIWKIGEVLFTVSTVPPDRAPDVSHLAESIIGHDIDTCSGQIFGGAELDNAKVARMLTNCTTSKGTVTVYYIGYPRQGGGLYLLATVVRPVEFNAAVEHAANDFDRRVRAGISEVFSHNR